jgi:hypothetical protein
VEEAEVFAVVVGVVFSRLIYTNRNVCNGRREMNVGMVK